MTCGINENKELKETMELYENLTWKDVKQNLKEKILFIPCGSIEQHGPHLPLNVDTVIANEIAKRVSVAVQGIVAPSINYGARSIPGSGGGFEFPGNVYIEGELLIKLYYNIFNSFLENGTKRIVVINAHWENYCFLVEAIEKLRENGKLSDKKICSLSWWDVICEEEMHRIFGKFVGWHAEHAGQAETALMLYYNENIVRMEERTDAKNIHPENIYCYPVPDDWKNDNGNLSDTTHVTYQMGEKLAELVEKKIIDLIEMRFFGGKVK